MGKTIEHSIDHLCGRAQFTCSGATLSVFYKKNRMIKPKGASQWAAFLHSFYLNSYIHASALGSCHDFLGWWAIKWQCSQINPASPVCSWSYYIITAMETLPKIHHLFLNSGIIQRRDTKSRVLGCGWPHSRTVAQTNSQQLRDRAQDLFMFRSDKIQEWWTEVSTTSFLI